MELRQGSVEGVVKGTRNKDQSEPQGRGYLVVLRSAVLRPPLHRIARFGLAGLAATVFYFVLTNILVLGGGLEPTTASVGAYLSALVCSYLLQSTFAFRVTGHSPAQVTRFSVTSVAGLLISYGAMRLATATFDLPYIVGAIAVCTLIPIVNYLAFSRWVFLSGPRKPRDG